MGKENSFLFCRMHDMRDIIWSNPDDGLGMMLPSVGVQIEKFGITHPEFSSVDAVFAISGFIDYDEGERRSKYAAEMIRYDNALEKAIEHVMLSFDELVAILNQAPPEDRTGIYLAAFVGAVTGAGDQEMKKLAFIALDKVLDIEESGVDVKDDAMPWSVLAYYTDFESWHDSKYGNAIIGKSRMYNSDKDSTNSGSSGGCYIATAVYGSYDCPEVWTLRRYRDERLLLSKSGKLFVALYYAVSPKVVSAFGNMKWFNVFWKKKLDKFVLSLNEKGYSNTQYHDESTPKR